MPETRGPPLLRPGDRVAIVAPSSPVLDRGDLDAGLDVLRAWRFEPVVSDQVRAATGHLAGDDEERAEQLNAALRDPSIRALLAARGGYGVTRILDRVDWDALARDPKLIVGFSDTGALLHAAWRRLGLVGLHGPFVSRLHLLAPFARTWLRRVLTGAGPVGALAQRPGAGDVRSVRPGTAGGPLVGGNLSVLAALAGTDDALDARGCVLLLEDVNEEPYRIDRMLVQLLRSGALDGVTGVAVGSMVGCDPPRDRPSATTEEVIEDVLAPLGVPIVSGFPIGHIDAQLAVPLGVRVRLDATAGSLTFLDPHMS